MVRRAEKAKMKSLKGIIIGLGLFALPIILQAQLAVSSTSTAETSSSDSIVTLTAEAQGLELVAREDLPKTGTFWLVTAGLGTGAMMPLPCPPTDASLPVFQMASGQFLVDGTKGQITLNSKQASIMTTESALAAQADAVVSLIEQVQGAQLMRDMTMMFGMDMELDSGGGMSLPLFAMYDPDQLWLEITNLTGGLIHAQLHNATNQVYAIWSTTDLLLPWQVESELWPDTNQTSVLPFTLPTLNRESLFLRAEDWTGKDSNADGVPDWWTWQYFGDFNVAATNDFDGDGIDNGTEYANGTDPNNITFTVRLGNRHFNTTNATGSFSVAAGTPSYAAVLVDDSNFDNAIWQPYDGNIHLNLGPADGACEVFLGLKGRAPESTPTWLGTTVYLERTVPTLIITNPAITTLALPYIQLQGWASKPLATVTYDLSNAVGAVTGQVGHVTGQFLDTNSLTFTTNYFQCFDVPLAEGANQITVHGTDLAGNIGSVTATFTLDYSNATNPPVISLAWPADGMRIGQDNITVHGTLSDPTASIRLQVTDGNATNEIAGVVERDGHFWIENVPLGGTNLLTLTATDVRTNTASMSLNMATDLSAGFSMAPVTDDLWAGTVTVQGTITGSNATVTVNSIIATNHGDGTWTAYNVPNPTGNMAVFAAQLTTPTQTNAVQLAVTKPAALKLVSATYDDEWTTIVGAAPFGTLKKKTIWHWTRGKGGSWHGATTVEPLGGGTPYVEWDADAAIQADGSVGDAHFTDTAGNDYWDAFPGVATWQSDFAQEVGALKVVRPGNGYYDSCYWNQRSGQADWELHTGGLSKANLKSLFVLTASALVEAGVNIQSGYLLEAGTNAPGPDITDIGEQLDADYVACKLLPDGATVSAPITAKAPLAKETGGQTKYKLVHQVVCVALGNTNLNRTTIGIREFVNLSGMPLGTAWTLSGDGVIWTNADGSAQYIAPASPTTATITATYKSTMQSVTFSVIPPSSIVAVAYTSNPNGEADTNGTLMGEYTSFTDVIGPTNVSFSNVNFRELQSSNEIIIWPDGKTNVVTYAMTTNAFQVSCDNTFPDGIGFPFVPTSHLYNGTNYMDFTFSSSWHDQYQDDNGNWVSFAPLTATWEFKGSDKKCRVTYLGVPADWQGPFSEP
jgi:hypothetical protein